MKSGQLIVLTDTIGVYGKLSPAVFERVQSDPHFAYALNKRIGRLGNWSIKRMIKAGNRFLKKRRLDPIEMLSESDIKKIADHQEAPPGSLLCKSPKGFRR